MITVILLNTIRIMGDISTQSVTLRCTVKLPDGTSRTIQYSPTAAEYDLWGSDDSYIINLLLNRNGMTL